MEKTNLKLKTLFLIIFMMLPISTINYVFVFADSRTQDFADYSMVSTETVAFDPPKISRYLDKYDQVKMDDCGTITVTGHPSLPVRTISLKFDLNDAIKNVTIEVSTYELNGTYLVSPAPKASYNETADQLTEPDPTIYNSSNLYPGKWYDYDIKEGIDPKTMSRAKFLVIHLYPVQYIPTSGKLTICKRADISIFYESEEQADSLKAVQSVQTYELLIITSSFLESHVLPLLDYKNSISISTFIKNTDEIYSSQSGRDTPEKIRNYIIYAVENYGITSVLIFGDADQVPVRYAYIPDEDLDDGDFVETDLYYADLQYSWDDNDDGLWGDLENDQIDGVPDILIGRLPVSTEFYAAAIVNKTISYERHNKQNDPWFNRILLLGALLDDEILKDYISDTFVWNNFTVKKLYNSQNDLSNSNVQTQIDDGYGFVNFAGHGNYNLWSLENDVYYTSNDADNLRNGLKLPIVFTMACLTSQFVDYECIGEYFMANPDGGAIAYFGASRTAWSYIGDYITNGLAGEMDWRFNKAFFDGNWISGAVWGQAITEYLQSHSIHTNYDGYYLDWKTVAEYGSPFMDPTLMIGGRALEETYTASIIDTEAPYEVYAGASFTVNLTVSYDFTIPTEIFSGILNVETGTWITDERENLVGEGNKTYSFELTAPEEETTWSIAGSVWYKLDGEWAHNEEEYRVDFDIFIVRAIDFSIDYVTPGNVTYGDVLTVMGSGATAGNTVNIYWDYVTAANLLNTTDGLPSGEFECEVDVPSTDYGDHYLWAKDLATGLSTMYGPISVVPDTYTHEITLFVGWNLIGLPCMPEDPSIEVVLSEIIDHVEVVWAYDGETKTWSIYLPSVPELGDLTEMVDDKGYWINVNTDVILTIYGESASVSVAILVDADIELEIQENLNQYVVDIETIYSDTRLLTYSGDWKSPEEIRSFIQDLYYSSSGISGVILVGELPYEIWEYFPGDIGPLPYYYEDLDGIFQDLNNDGMLDYHIEDDQQPEIWVSWMRPYSDNVAQSINDYLLKCHLYYSGNISYQDKALVACDQDWIDCATEVTLALLDIYQENEITVINGTTGISPQEYLNEYTKQYEFTSVWSHSDNDGHEFVRGVLNATTIKSLDNGSKIILIWGCHAADFYKSPYKGDILASSYIFNNNGMASIAATRSIGIENYWIVINNLAEGDIIGEAFLKWINYSYNQSFIENRFPDEEFNKFMWGFILMGDPFIQLNKYQQLLN